MKKCAGKLDSVRLHKIETRSYLVQVQSYERRSVQGEVTLTVYSSDRDRGPKWDLKLDEFVPNSKDQSQSYSQLFVWPIGSYGGKWLMVLCKHLQPPSKHSPAGAEESHGMSPGWDVKPRFQIRFNVGLPSFSRYSNCILSKPLAA
jgi:hypothetical protein